MDSIYLPVHESDKCTTGWKITTQRRGKGGFSDTFASCCNNNCQYVAKIQKDTPASRNELEIHKLASDFDVAVPVIDSWSYENKLVIIMPVLLYTLSEIFNQLLFKCRDDESCRNVADIVLDYIKRVITKLDILFRHNIIHNDMNLANIMTDDKDNIFIIDYGIAQVIKLPSLLSSFYAKDVRRLISVTSKIFNGTPVWKYLNKLNADELLKVKK